MSKCEICDRDIVPRGGGYVLHDPPRAIPLSFADPLPGEPVVYRILTCDSAVCGFRATHHGVPGRVYTGYRR